MATFCSLARATVRFGSGSQHPPLLLRRHCSWWGSSSHHGSPRNNWRRRHSSSSRGSSTSRGPFVVTSLSLGSFLSSRGNHSQPTSRSKPALSDNTPVEISRVMLPDDTNPLGNVHGGTILKLIEQAGAVVSARHCNSVNDSGKTPVPLITVLARVEHMDFYEPMYDAEIWATEQKRLIEVVHPHSQRVTLPGSDYLTLYLKPQAVARAVIDMVVDWRGHSHVAQ